MSRSVRLTCVLALVVIAPWACARNNSESPQPTHASTRHTVPALPDLSTLATQVQEQIRRDYSALLAIENDSSRSAADRGEAYGSVGRRLLAVDYSEAAQPFLQTAQSLMSADMRWPYFLGHAYRRSHDPEKAAAAFRQTLALSPDDVPAMIWLGETELSLGKPQDAETVLAKATAREPRSAAAWFHRGRAAEAQGQHQTAIEYLSRAVTLDPSADAIQYQLALAYRNVGNMTAAEAHLRHPADAESVAPRDPLMEALPALSESAASYVVRGVAALDRRDWKAAIASFRAASALAPNDGTIQLNLGTAMYLDGDRDDARKAFTVAIQLAPHLPKAHYSYGLLQEDEGHDTEAIGQFTAAVADDPNYAEAHASLADALRRNGRIEDALPHYARVLAIDPGASQARFGYAMGLVRLGRWADARNWLTESVHMYPDQPGFPHALARILAAAPDAAVRDGGEALRITKQLLQVQRSATLLETVAMAQAELGRYDDAVVSEREAMRLARLANHTAPADSMHENLASYQRRQPCRIPWRPDDPVFFPHPQSDQSTRR